MVFSVFKILQFLGKLTILFLTHTLCFTPFTNCNCLNIILCHLITANEAVSLPLDAAVHYFLLHIQAHMQEIHTYQPEVQAYRRNPDYLPYSVTEIS